MLVGVPCVALTLELEPMVCASLRIDESRETAMRMRSSMVQTSHYASRCATA